MATELTKIKVDFLSLVPKGANGKRIIYKAADGKEEGAEAIERLASRIKKSNDRQMVYAPVYAPDEVDTQSEFAKAEAIQDAAYAFMKSRNVLNVDENHDFDPKAAFVAESWIVKGVDSLFPDECEGAWIVGIKVEDPDLWGRIKKGELEGISMAGSALKVRKSDDTGKGDGLLSKLEELLSRVLKKEEPVAKAADKAAQAEQAGKVDKELEEFVARIAKAVKDEVGSDLAKKYDDLAARFEAIEKSMNGKTSGGVDGSGKNDESCGIA